MALTNLETELHEYDAGLDFGRIISKYEKGFERVYRMLAEKEQTDLRRNDDIYLVILMRKEIPRLFTEELKGDNQSKLTAIFYFSQFLETKR